MKDDRTDPGDEDPSFSEALANLDRHGSNVLVVGQVPDAGTVAASRELFGEPHPDRWRLLVHAREGSLDLDRRMKTGPSGPRPANLEVVRYVIPSRSAAAARAEPRPFETTVTSDRLSDLGRTVSDLILERQRSADGRTTEIRVCFDLLSTLLAEYDREPVFRFVNMMTGQIRNVGGMGQFYLPFPVDSESVSLLAPLFDAVVELRYAGDGYQQRWHLVEQDVASEWQPL